MFANFYEPLQLVYLLGERQRKTEVKDKCNTVMVTNAF